MHQSDQSILFIHKQARAQALHASYLLMRRVNTNFFGALSLLTNKE